MLAEIRYLKYFKNSGLYSKFLLTLNVIVKILVSFYVYMVKNILISQTHNLQIFNLLRINFYKSIFNYFFIKLNFKTLN